MSAIAQPRPALPRLRAPSGGGWYAWLALLSLVIAAVSLAWPAGVTYDPWSWLLWGREILHGHLAIAGGSSWKPLPVIFTTVFALFGSAQPNLWLLIARAGLVLTVLMSARLALRVAVALTRPTDAELAGPSGSPEGPASAAPPHSAGPLARLGALLPALSAAAIALVCVALTPENFQVSMSLGYSEAVMVATVLIAVERACDGHHRQAFALGTFAALDRPETWVVWGPYGLWLMWRDRRSWPLVIGLAAAVLLLWGVPQKLGGGTPGGLVNHALQNHVAGSAVNSSSPFWDELYNVAGKLALRRVEVAALLLILGAAWTLLRAFRAEHSLAAALRRHLALGAAAACGLAGFLWWVLIGIETQAGFAGNPRYAVLGLPFVYAGGCAAYAWAGVWLARQLGRVRWLPAWLAGWGQRATAGTVAMLAVFLFVPGWFARPLPTVSSMVDQVRYQADVRTAVSNLIAGSGGHDRLLTCGTVMTHNLDTGLVAWYLDRPLGRVQALPPTLETGAPGPNVIFQLAWASGLGPRPTYTQIAAWERAGSHYSVTRKHPVNLYLSCAK